MFSTLNGEFQAKLFNRQTQWPSPATLTLPQNVKKGPLIPVQPAERPQLRSTVTLLHELSRALSRLFHRLEHAHSSVQLEETAASFHIGFCVHSTNEVRRDNVIKVNS